ncbi:MAG: sulfur carrier protein ThiS [Candidatus Binatia bacterium]
MKVKVLTLKFSVGTNLKPYSLATKLGGRCEYGFFYFQMKIKINGEDKEIANGLNLGALLEELRIRSARVVVEHNRNIVSRDLYSATMLADGDAVEIVHFVGGG